MASSDAQGAARALRAVLDHPDVDLAVDERFLESMLRHALTTIPGLGNALFRRGEMEYRFGKRGAEADLIGLTRGIVEIECEVKVHSNLNKAKSGWQLDNYAHHAPESALLLVLTAHHRLEMLAAEMERKQVRSRSRWTLLHLGDVRDALDAVGAPLAEPGGMIETLACSLARLGLD